MSIPASMIVDITPRAIRAGSTDLQFNGMVFTTNPTASMCDIFTSAQQVGEQFGFESPEYTFAQNYWEADELKTRSPAALYFARLLKEETAAWIRGYQVTSTLEEFKAVTDGALTISINGSSVQASGIDLSTCTSLSEVATKVAEKLTGTSGAYNSGMNCFIFTTTQTGSEAKITYPTASSSGTDLAEMLCLTEQQGAVLWQGTDAQPFSQNVNSVLNISQNWVTFTTIDEPEIADATEMAQWSSTNFGFIYFPFTTQTNAEVSGNTSDMASALSAAGVSATAPVYGPVNYTSFFMGMLAATDFEATNGMKTYAFKRSGSLPSYVTDGGVAQVLKTKMYNFLGNFQTRNAQFDVSAWGTLIDSTYKFIDELAGMIWLANAWQVALVDLMTTVNRIPYTERGYTMIRTSTISIVNRGLNNGYIEPGVTLSASQKSALIEAIGQDVSQTLENTGWYLRVSDPGATARSNRESPICQLYVTYGGAVHKIDGLASVFL